MIINTANTALLEELESHTKLFKIRKQESGSINKKGNGSHKPAKNSLAAIKEKMNGLAGLTKEEIEKAVEAGLIFKDQTWNWVSSNADSLREGLKNVENGQCQGPFTDVDELVASLKP